MQTKKSQRGIALIFVMVMLLLTTLLIIGSARLNLISEKLAGNNTDYQRAYEAAEALLGDAKLDLACANTLAGCGIRIGLIPPIPCTVSDFAALQATLTPLTPPCLNGICLDLGNVTSGDNNSFWRTATGWTTYTAAAVGASYGQYTNATPVATNAVNPMLLNNARYWIEVLPYGSSAGGRSVDSENTMVGTRQVTPGDCKYVYRITAAARGVKTGTTAVLQSYYMFASPQI